MSARENDPRSIDELRRENEQLREQLRESQEVLTAIQTGELDSLVVQTTQGPQVFSLVDALTPYRNFVEATQHGAVALSPSQTVVFSNSALSSLLGIPPEETLGVAWPTLIAQEDAEVSKRLLEQAAIGPCTAEIRLQASDGSMIPVSVSANPLSTGPPAAICLVVTDLTPRKKAELKLQESELRYRSLVTATSVLDWVTDASGNVVEDMPRWREFTGFTQDQIKGSGWLDAVHPDDREPTAVVWARSTKTRTQYQTEFRLRRHDGEYRTVLSRGVPILEEDGSVREWVGSCADITELKKAEDAIRTSELRYRSLMAATNQIVWATDGAGQYLEDVPSWREFTGQTVEETKGTGWLEAVHPDDREATQAAWAKAIAARTMNETEIRLRRHDGEYRIVHARGVPILAEDGSVREWVGMCSDITERKQAEEALARSEFYFRRIAEANLIGVGFGDLKGNVSYANDEMLRMMGYSREDFEAGRTNWRERVAPEFAEVNRRSDETLLATGLTSRFEMEFLTPDGTRTPFIGSAALVDAETTMFVTAVLDLTEAKKAEREREALLHQLRLADQKKDEFLAMLAHELRNPVAAVRNAATVLSLTNEVKRTSSAREVIERQTGQLSHLIDDLLDVFRITRGKIRLNIERVDVVRALRHAVEQTEPLIKDRQHSLVTEFEDVTLQVLADPTRLEQMVGNLLTNAAKYTQNGGRIQLRAKQENNEIVISVQDNGGGIPPENIAAMFQLFTQGDRSLARSEGGLGIGLTIVRSLAEMHGGSVSAASEGLGLGSTFTLRLPAAKKPETKASSPENASNVDNGGANILVVDDNRDAADSLADILIVFGHRVEVAYDGYEAINKAQNLTPDFVLLDIGLPGLNGYEVARRLRQEQGCQSTVIIAVTGYGQDEDRRRSQEAGFDHHLVKPVDFDQLSALLVQHS